MKIKLFLLIFLCANSFIFSQKSDGIEVKHTFNPDKTSDLSYKKNYPGSIYLKVKFKKTNTFASDFEKLITNDYGNLIHFGPSNPNKDINIKFKFSYTKGNPNPKIDSLFHYVLPFKKGKNVQTESILYTYVPLKDRFDLILPIYFVRTEVADTICAMRRGIVVEITNECVEDPKEIDVFYSKKNEVIIEHSDGTCALYSGFKKNEIFVKLGQIINTNDELGILEKLNNNFYYLFFKIFYLKKETDINYKADFDSRIHFTLTPYFYTSNGLSKLKDNNYYTVDFTSEIISQK